MYIHVRVFGGCMDECVHKWVVLFLDPHMPRRKRGTFDFYNHVSGLNSYTCTYIQMCNCPSVMKPVIHVQLKQPGGFSSH